MGESTLVNKYFMSSFCLYRFSGNILFDGQFVSLWTAHFNFENNLISIFGKYHLLRSEHTYLTSTSLRKPLFFKEEKHVDAGNENGLRQAYELKYALLYVTNKLFQERKCLFINFP